MQKNNFTNVLIFSTLLLISPSFFACGGKKQSDVVTTPATQTTNELNCDVWKGNRTFMTASYGLSETKGDKIFINKLSILQLMNSLNLQSDAGLEKIKTELIDMITHTPQLADSPNIIEFAQEAIAKRDRIAIGIQSHIDLCPE